MSPGVPPIGPLEWSDETVASLWEYYSERRPETYFTAQFGDRIVEETLRFVDHAAAVCDFGCGAGYLLERLLEHRRAAGLDFTRGSVEVARRRVDGSANLIGVHHVDEAAHLFDTFDALYFVETVEHILPHHMDGTFDLLHRLPKPRGIIVCTTPHDEDLSEQEVFCPVTRKYFHRYHHVHSFTEASLAALFRARGFEVVRTFTIDFAARRPVHGLKGRLRAQLGRKNRHLVLIGRTPA